MREISGYGKEPHDLRRVLTPNVPCVKIYLLLEFISIFMRRAHRRLTKPASGRDGEYHWALFKRNIFAPKASPIKGWSERNISGSASKTTEYPRLGTGTSKTQLVHPTLDEISTNLRPHTERTPEAALIEDRKLTQYKEVFDFLQTLDHDMMTLYETGQMLYKFTGYHTEEEIRDLLVELDQHGVITILPSGVVWLKAHPVVSNIYQSALTHPDETAANIERRIAELMRRRLPIERTRLRVESLAQTHFRRLSFMNGIIPGVVIAHQWRMHMWEWEIGWEEMLALFAGAIGPLLVHARWGWHLHRIYVSDVAKAVVSQAQWKKWRHYGVATGPWLEMTLEIEALKVSLERLRRGLPIPAVPADHPFRVAGDTEADARSALVDHVRLHGCLPAGVDAATALGEIARARGVLRIALPRDPETAADVALEAAEVAEEEAMLVEAGVTADVRSIAAAAPLPQHWSDESQHAAGDEPPQRPAEARARARANRRDDDIPFEIKAPPSAGLQTESGARRGEAASLAATAATSNSASVSNPPRWGPGRQVDDPWDAQRGVGSSSAQQRSPFIPFGSRSDGSVEAPVRTVAAAAECPTHSSTTPAATAAVATVTSPTTFPAATVAPRDSAATSLADSVSGPVSTPAVNTEPTSWPATTPVVPDAVQASPAACPPPQPSRRPPAASPNSRGPAPSPSTEGLVPWLRRKLRLRQLAADEDPPMDGLGAAPGGVTVMEAIAAEEAAVASAEAGVAARHEAAITAARAAARAQLARAAAAAMKTGDAPCPVSDAAVNARARLLVDLESPSLLARLRAVRRIVFETTPRDELVRALTLAPLPTPAEEATARDALRAMRAARALEGVEVAAARVVLVAATATAALRAQTGAVDGYSALRTANADVDAALDALADALADVEVAGGAVSGEASAAVMVANFAVADAYLAATHTPFRSLGQAVGVDAQVPADAPLTDASDSGVAPIDDPTSNPWRPTPLPRGSALVAPRPPLLAHPLYPTGVRTSTSPAYVAKPRTHRSPNPLTGDGRPRLSVGDVALLRERVHAAHMQYAVPFSTSVASPGVHGDADEVAGLAEHAHLVSDGHAGVLRQEHTPSTAARIKLSTIYQESAEYGPRAMMGYLPSADGPAELHDASAPRATPRDAQGTGTGEGDAPAAAYSEDTALLDRAEVDFLAVAAERSKDVLRAHAVGVTVDVGDVASARAIVQRYHARLVKDSVVASGVVDSLRAVVPDTSESGDRREMHGDIMGGEVSLNEAHMVDQNVVPAIAAPIQVGEVGDLTARLSHEAVRELYGPRLQRLTPAMRHAQALAARFGNQPLTARPDVILPGRASQSGSVLWVASDAGPYASRMAVDVDVAYTPQPGVVHGIRSFIHKNMSLAGHVNAEDLTSVTSPSPHHGTASPSHAATVEAFKASAARVNAIFDSLGGTNSRASVASLAHASGIGTLSDDIKTDVDADHATIRDGRDVGVGEEARALEAMEESWGRGSSQMPLQSMSMHLHPPATPLPGKKPAV